MERAALAPPEGVKPFVVCAAIRNDLGHIICSPRHYDSICRFQINCSFQPNRWHTGSVEQGFVDQFGNWLTRAEALEIARANDQIKRRCGGDDIALYSENLY